jgi:hypothetical protein
MADMDLMNAMGISGFGKTTKKKQLDPKRFDKNKRESEVRHLVNKSLIQRNKTLGLANI